MVVRSTISRDLVTRLVTSTSPYSNHKIPFNDPSKNAKRLYDAARHLLTSSVSFAQRQRLKDELVVHLRASSFPNLTAYLDRFEFLWSQLDLLGISFTDEDLLGFLVRGLGGYGYRRFGDREESECGEADEWEMWVNALRLLREERRVDFWDALDLVWARARWEVVGVGGHDGDGEEGDV